jgi:hypothetical protein
MEEVFGVKLAPQFDTEMIRAGHLISVRNKRRGEFYNGFILEVTPLQITYATYDKHASFTTERITTRTLNVGDVAKGIVEIATTSDLWGVVAQ